MQKTFEPTGSRARNATPMTAMTPDYCWHVLAFTVPSALDDCICLQRVMGFLSARLGLGLVDLHRLFAVRFDEPASVAQVRTLLDE